LGEEDGAERTIAGGDDSAHDDSWVEVNEQKRQSFSLGGILATRRQAYMHARRQPCSAGLGTSLAFMRI